jgi:peptide/nickel transport system permease protein
LAPFPPNDVHGLNTLSGPSSQFWLGTDWMGRDLLSRIIYGARISLIVGLAASLIASVIEIVLGLLSGYIGGKFDLIAQRFVDAIMCFPPLLLMMVIISMVKPGMVQLIIVLGIQGGIGGSRVIRSATMAIKENMYIQSSEAIGASTGNILIHHILPNIMAPVIIQFTTRVPGVILTEAGLSFLGYGIPPPAASWGAMLSGNARTFMYLSPWMVIWPGVALSVVVYGVNMFGDAVRDVLDPRLRGGIGRYDLKIKRPKNVHVKSDVIAGD